MKERKKAKRQRKHHENKERSRRKKGKKQRNKEQGSMKINHLGHLNENADIGKRTQHPKASGQHHQALHQRFHC
jgi:hypothetical protein